MGQKVNPHGLRVGVIKDWDSRWYASEEKVGDLLVEDYKIREYLKKTLYAAGVPKIEIERNSDVVTVFLHCARPGLVIGRGGEQIAQYTQMLQKMTGKKVRLQIVEVRNPDMDAQLVAENIAQQLEKRISFRRAMKNSMARAMRAGAKGIKASCGGRLGGAEIARSEHYHEGTIPLQTIRADIDYGFAEAATTFGRIGVKVWIYKGEVLSQTLRTTPRTMDTSRPYQERRERRPRRDGDRRGGVGRGPRPQGSGDRAGGHGSYNRGERPADGTRPQGQGSYNRGDRPAGGARPQGQGSYNRSERPAGGTRPQGQGSYNRGERPAGGTRPQGQGGYNRSERPAGGTRPQGQSSYDRTPGQRVSSERRGEHPQTTERRPAPAPKEGGTQ